jgi:hypothetical protein
VRGRFFVKIEEIMAVMSMSSISSFKVPRLGSYLHPDLHQSIAQSK